MLDHVEVARILDILGNRNRRRIIELLRQKPCFVTEISDRLMLSPKAVIEHLQLMEREEILSFRLDDRRRKYYYLANDISIMVQLQKQENVVLVVPESRIRVRKSLRKLRKMVEIREEISHNLSHIDNDIDVLIKEILTISRDLISDDTEIDLAIAIAHYDLSLDELRELTSLNADDLGSRLEDLKKKRIIEQTGQKYRLCDAHAE
jgi:ArsR family transcriptional regulator